MKLLPLLVLNKRDWQICSSTLSKLRPEFPDCIIAGGCLRDMIYGFVPKDIDVFTFHPIDESEQMLEGDQNSSQDSEGRVLLCSKFREGYAYPLQIITLNEHRVRKLYEESEGPDAKFETPVHFGVAQFNLGLNQLWFDHEGLMAKPTYGVDAVGEHFTLVYCTSALQFEATLRKWVSYTDKFKHWTLRVPAKFHQHLPDEDRLLWLMRECELCHFRDQDMVVFGRLTT